MSERALLINTGDTSFDKIWAHYRDPNKYKLTEKQKELKGRWLAAFTLRQKFHSRQQAVNAMMDKYGISRAQAFMDLRNAERLFGNVLKADRQGSLAILYEYAHKFYLLAVREKDLKSIGKALELLGKYSEVDKDISLTFNPEKLENKPIKMSIKKSVEEMIVNHLNKGVLDFNKIVDAEAEVVDDEE